MPFGLRRRLSDTPDGSNIRDYIDVVDLAKAHVTAIARMIEGKNREKYEIFNIGTGRGVSVLELVRKFEEVNNLKLNYKIVGRRAGDIVAIWADPSYANDELGWKAERSLDQTLRCGVEVGEAYPRHRITASGMPDRGAAFRRRKLPGSASQACFRINLGRPRIPEPPSA